MKASKFEENNNSAKTYEILLSENSDKWLSLKVNKMTFYVATLDDKYQNGNLDVQDLQRCHLFSCKRVSRCSKSNAKRGSLNQNPENLKTA